MTLLLALSNCPGCRVSGFHPPHVDQGTVLAILPVWLKSHRAAVRIHARRAGSVCSSRRDWTGRNGRRMKTRNLLIAFFPCLFHPEAHTFIQSQDCSRTCSPCSLSSLAHRCQCGLLSCETAEEWGYAYVAHLKWNHTNSEVNKWLLFRGGSTALLTCHGALWQSCKGQLSSTKTICTVMNRNCRMPFLNS